MPNYIRKITLPSGGTYVIKDDSTNDQKGTLQAQIDALASAIAGGVSFIVAWKGTSTPVVADIPKGVVVTYNGTNYTGTLEASSAQAGAFYLVYSETQEGNKDVYDEYVVIDTGTSSSPAKGWEKIGDTQITFGTDVVLGEATTFTNSSSTVSFSGGTTDVVLGEATTFTASGTAVGKTTKYLSASASGTAVGANGTANAITGFGEHTTEAFVKSIKKASLNTTTVPNVTNVGSASTWSFTMGTGNDSETLIIGGANGSAPTLGTEKTVATGSLSNGFTNVAYDIDRTGNAVTALGTPTTEAVLTGVQVTTQPTITLTANASTGTGRITYVESLGTVTQPTITVGTNDKVTAIKTLGTATAAAQTITVGTNDPVTVLTPGT